VRMRMRDLGHARTKCCKTGLSSHEQHLWRNLSLTLDAVCMTVHCVYQRTI
jgi:hypothetical protein